MTSEVKEIHLVFGGDVDEETVLARGFAEPHGAPRLREVVKSGDRVLILIEDGTRGTPITRLLPLVLDAKPREVGENVAATNEFIANRNAAANAYWEESFLPLVGDN